MAQTRNSITINAPYDLVFDISNHIERWTELFGDEYVSADVLERKGNEITFKLTDDENRSWVSKRWLHKDHYFAIASRHDPMFPFVYMKILWLYVPRENGIEMIWMQDFEMDPKFTKFTSEQIAGFINEHSVHNMGIFKKVIEEEAKKGAAKA